MMTIYLYHDTKYMYNINMDDKIVRKVVIRYTWLGFETGHLSTAFIADFAPSDSPLQKRTKLLLYKNKSKNCSIPTDTSIVLFSTAKQF